AEARLLGATDRPRTTAAGTCLGPGAGLGAVARAALARREPRDVDLFLDAGERLLEGDGHVVAEVVAAIRSLPARPRPDAAAKEGVEDVGERHIREVHDQTAAYIDDGVTKHVVAPPTPRVGQHRVRLARLLEANDRNQVVRVAVR